MAEEKQPKKTRKINPTKQKQLTWGDAPRPMTDGRCTPYQKHRKQRTKKHENRKQHQSLQQSEIKELYDNKLGPIAPKCG